MFKKLINNCAAILFPDEEDLTSKSKLSEGEVSKIAKAFGEKENWLPKYSQGNPTLKKEGKKLLWQVNFRIDQGTDIVMLGQHRFITIDDETKKVEKFVGMR